MSHHRRKSADLPAENTSDLRKFVIPKKTPKSLRVDNNNAKIEEQKADAPCIEPISSSDPSYMTLIQIPFTTNAQGSALKLRYDLQNVRRIVSPALRKKFDDFKTKVPIACRTENVGFIEISSDERELKLIAQRGVRVGNAAIGLIGDVEKGVYVWDHPDRIGTAPWIVGVPRRILFVRTLRGKVSFVSAAPGLQPSVTTPETHSFRLKKLPRQDTTRLEKIAEAQTFHFEFDELLVPVEFPSGVLPVAVADVLICSEDARGRPSRYLRKNMPLNVVFTGRLLIGGTLRSKETNERKKDDVENRKHRMIDNVSVSTVASGVRKPPFISDKDQSASMLSMRKFKKWATILDDDLFGLLLEDAHGRLPFTKNVTVRFKSGIVCLNYFGVRCDSKDQKMLDRFTKICQMMRFRKLVGIDRLVNRSFLLYLPPGELAAEMGLPMPKLAKEDAYLHLISFSFYNREHPSVDWEKVFTLRKAGPEQLLDLTALRDLLKRYQKSYLQLSETAQKQRPEGFDWLVKHKEREQGSSAREEDDLNTHSPNEQPRKGLHTPPPQWGVVQSEFEQKSEERKQKEKMEPFSHKRFVSFAPKQQQEQKVEDHPKPSFMRNSRNDNLFRAVIEATNSSNASAEKATPATGRPAKTPSPSAQSSKFDPRVMRDRRPSGEKPQVQTQPQVSSPVRNTSGQNAPQEHGLQIAETSPPRRSSELTNFMGSEGFRGLQWGSGPARSGSHNLPSSSHNRQETPSFRSEPPISSTWEPRGVARTHMYNTGPSCPQPSLPSAMRPSQKRATALPLPNTGVPFKMPKFNQEPEEVYDPQKAYANSPTYSPMATPPDSPNYDDLEPQSVYQGQVARPMTPSLVAGDLSEPYSPSTAVPMNIPDADMNIVDMEESDDEEEDVNVVINKQTQNCMSLGSTGGAQKKEDDQKPALLDIVDKEALMRGEITFVRPASPEKSLSEPTKIIPLESEDDHKAHQPKMIPLENTEILKDQDERIRKDPQIKDDPDKYKSIVKPISHDTDLRFTQPPPQEVPSLYSRQQAEQTVPGVALTAAPPKRRSRFDIPPDFSKGGPIVVRVGNMDAPTQIVPPQDPRVLIPTTSSATPHIGTSFGSLQAASGITEHFIPPQDPRVLLPEASTATSQIGSFGNFQSTSETMVRIEVEGELATQNPFVPPPPGTSRGAGSFSFGSRDTDRRTWIPPGQMGGQQVQQFGPPRMPQGQSQQQQKFFFPTGRGGTSQGAPIHAVPSPGFHQRPHGQEGSFWFQPGQQSGGYPGMQQPRSLIPPQNPPPQFPQPRK